MAVAFVTSNIALCTFFVNRSACAISSCKLSSFVCSRISSLHRLTTRHFSSSTILYCLSLVKVDSGSSGIAL